MTCREKLRIERPDLVGPMYHGGCMGCPHHYDYLEMPSYCSAGNAICTKCWDREIPVDVAKTIITTMKPDKWQQIYSEYLDRKHDPVCRAGIDEDKTVIHMVKRDEISNYAKYLAHKATMNMIDGKLPRVTSNKLKDFGIRKVIFNDPATIVIWMNGDKTVVKAVNEPFDKEKGLAMAITKYALGNEGNYYNILKAFIEEEK